LKGRERRCFVSPIFRRRSMKLLKKYVILLKMTRTEDLHKESFVKIIPTMMMIGMMISIMEISIIEIIIEAMIKGLRLGPTAQYFAKKPPRLWRSCFRKWMSTSGLTMTFTKEGRKLTDFLR
jgi:hypothetical protein